MIGSYQPRNRNYNKYPKYHKESSKGVCSYRSNNKKSYSEEKKSNGNINKKAESKRFTLPVFDYKLDYACSSTSCYKYKSYRVYEKRKGMKKEYEG